MPEPRIAVLGAGLAGLACARTLAAGGRAVALFDKGRTVGGRLATRRVELSGRVLQFDHGAQYLTARGTGFAAALETAGAGRWSVGGDGSPWSVGVPGMQSLGRALLGVLPLEAARHVTAITGRPGAWLLEHHPAARVRPGRPPPDQPAACAPPFDAVAVTAPASQAAALLGSLLPALAARLGLVRFAPCWTLLLAFPRRLDLPDWQRPESGAIGWAARDSSKPGRDDASECWVVQASPAWSRTHLEAEASVVVAALLAELGALAGGVPAPDYAAAHRWRFSLVEAALGDPCVWDGAARLGVAGDWCLAGRGEAAWDSGVALARAMLG